MASSDDQQAAATDADALVRSPTGSRGEDELFDTPPRKTERDDLMPRLQFDENAASPSPSKPSEYVTPDSLPPSNGSGRADAPATLTLSTESTEKPVLQQEESVEEPVRSKLEARKQLDFESPIPGPGKSRNIRAPTVVTELMDLKVSIVANETRALPKTDPFTVYKIKTDVIGSNYLYSRPNYEVWRRYRDFEWLREQVEKTHPTLITPPLPGKQLSRYFDHLSKDFVQERQNALEKFLYRLAVHPYFSFDRNLFHFLTDHDPDLATYQAESSTSSNKLVNLMSSSVKQATAAIKLRNTADPEFAIHGEYFTALGDKMGIMERIGNRLHTDREGLASELVSFASVIDKWSALEPPLASALNQLSQCAQFESSAVTSLNESNAYSLLMPTKEYQLFCSSAVSAIKRRDALQFEQEQSSEDREKKKKAHQEAVTEGKVQKVAKMAGQLEKIGVAAEKALDNLAQANEALRVDIEKWREAKDIELGVVMRRVADGHIKYHQKCFEEWEKVLHALRLTNSASNDNLGGAFNRL